jgi:tetratricopeptide (TPR) repeat protein
MTADIDTLIRHSDDSAIAPQDALAGLADLVNQSGDTNRLDGIEAALRWGERLRTEHQSKHDRALVHYFTANAHAIRRRLAARAPGGEWNDPDLGEEIRHLRLALQTTGWTELHPYQQCQILTNLGNALLRCGRCVEALEWYERALAVDTGFGMAVANRGLALVSYATFVHEPTRRNAAVRAARADLARALELTLEEGARDTVGAALARLESLAPAGFSWDQEVSPGTLERFPANDRPYRRWGLTNRLFLDELNDLSSWAVGARDTLSLPGHVAPLNEGPRFIGFFNQIKQEFVAARWMLFEGLRQDEMHPADAEVILADTMDYPVYSFRTEQLRTAFRSSYSLLDKLAFFLNQYLRLGIPDKRVTFREIWFASCKPTKRLNPALVQPLSDPLRALVWIAQDLFEPDSAYGTALLPDAKDLWEIRRHLEHRYLKLHGEGWSEEWNAASWREGLRDDLAMSLDQDVFAGKTLRLLKMVRAALMYLVWAIQAEEIARRLARNPGALTPPMVLPPLPNSR